MGNPVAPDAPKVPGISGTNGYLTNDQEMFAQHVHREMVKVLSRFDAMALIRAVGELESGVDWQTLSAETRDVFRQLAQRL